MRYLGWLQLCIPERLLFAPVKTNRVRIQLREVARVRLHFVDHSIQSDEWRSHCWQNSNAISWFESGHTPQIPQNLTTACSPAYRSFTLLLSDAFPNQFGDRIQAIGTLFHVLHFLFGHERLSFGDLHNPIGSDMTRHAR
jgi:hypothetical protein